jgi:hypothetical protein
VPDEPGGAGGAGPVAGPTFFYGYWGYADSPEIADQDAIYRVVPPGAPAKIALPTSVGDEIEMLLVDFASPSTGYALAIDIDAMDERSVHFLRYDAASNSWTVVPLAGAPDYFYELFPLFISQLEPSVPLPGWHNRFHALQVATDGRVRFVTTLSNFELQGRLGVEGRDALCPSGCPVGAIIEYTFADGSWTSTVAPIPEDAHGSNPLDDAPHLASVEQDGTCRILVADVSMKIVPPFDGPREFHTLHQLSRSPTGTWSASTLFEALRGEYGFVAAAPDVLSVHWLDGMDAPHGMLCASGVCSEFAVPDRLQRDRLTQLWAHRINEPAYVARRPLGSSGTVDIDATEILTLPSGEASDVFDEFDPSTELYFSGSLPDLTRPDVIHVLYSDQDIEQGLIEYEYDGDTFSRSANPSYPVLYRPEHVIAGGSGPGSVIPPWTFAFYD